MTRSSAASTGCPADPACPRPTLPARGRPCLPAADPACPVRPACLRPIRRPGPASVHQPFTIRPYERAGPWLPGRPQRAGGPPADGEGDRMVGMLAIAAAAGWLLAFSLCAVVTRLTPRWASDAAPWPGLGGARPALVNLVVTRGRLSAAAYPATILDLAAK